MARFARPQPSYAAVFVTGIIISLTKFIWLASLATKIDLCSINPTKENNNNPLNN
jgi:hypothetical protein